MSDKLPVVSFSVASPDINYGRIDKIYFTELGNPLADLLKATIEGRIDESDIITAGAIRELHVIGNKPAPEKAVLDISLGRQAHGKKSHTLPFIIDEVGDVNYAMLKKLEENPGETWLVWYASEKYWYGGTAGIEAQISLEDVLPESADELDKFEGSLTWKGDTPERIINPLT